MFVLWRVYVCTLRTAFGISVRLFRFTPGQRQNESRQEILSRTNRLRQEGTKERQVQVQL